MATTTTLTSCPKGTWVYLGTGPCALMPIPPGAVCHWIFSSVAPAPDSPYMRNSDNFAYEGTGNVYCRYPFQDGHVVLVKE